MDSSALSISSLFLFHSHIHFHLYILTYTYPFNLQSQKRIKKFFTVGFWTRLARLWIIFLALGPGKKKEYLNPHELVPIRATRGPAGWPFTMRVADLNFQNRSLRGGLWETCKSSPIRPAPTPSRQCETCNALDNMDVLNIRYIESSLMLNVSLLCIQSWCLLILAVIHDISSYLSVANVFATLYLWCASSYSLEIDMWKVAKQVMVCKKTLKPLC